MNVESFSYSSYAGDKTDRKSILGYYTYVRENLVTWRSKKQNVLSRSSAEAEYRSIAQTASEIVWLRLLLSEFGFSVQTSMLMHCDNQTVIVIANNLAFHERTKHIEVNCHFIRNLEPVWLRLWESR